MPTNSLNYDVVVVGGGISGTMAAIAAAREGAKTLLIERYAALGGMATLGLVQPITTWGVGGSYVIGGTGKALLEKLVEQGPDAATPMSQYGPCCDAEYLKILLEQEALAAGVELLYHCWVRDVKIDDSGAGAVREVVVLSKGGEFNVSADVVVDASGDADIATFAGVPFDVGSQGVTLMFLIAGIDRNRAPSKPGDIRELYMEHKISYRKLTIFWHPRPGWAYLNVTEVEGGSELDPVYLTHATVDCRRQAWDIVDVLREYVPGFEDIYIAQTAPTLGVRESRHIRGDYLLTLDDVLAGRDYDDNIARASCPVDVHGSETSGRHQYYALKASYAIPYRCLKSARVPNLLVTGRPISADHDAHSSLRRMAPGFALGEAAGVAAAMAVKTGSVHTINVKALQARLRDLNAILEAPGKTGS